MADLNLSKFKKVCADKNCTTLRHQDGHELKVAHGGLTTKLRKELDRLPIHAADGVDAMNAPAAQDPQAMPDLPQEEPDTTVNDNTPAPSGPSSPVPGTPQSPEQQYLQSYNDTKAAHAKEFGEQDALFDQDLKNGHITPETYQSLFAKKDTLGKVGTIFGLMMSGAASGLAGQKVGLMNTMDQQIKNDLEAQVQSKTNAQNFYKLNLQRIKQEQAEIPESQARARLTDAQTKVAAYTAANLQANRAAFHHLALVAQGQAPGGSMTQQQAQQALVALGGQVNNENLGIADRAASGMAALNQNTASNNPTSPVNDQKINNLQVRNQMKLMGAPTDSDMEAIRKESANQKTTEAIRAAYNDSYNKLNKMALAGTLSPNARKAEVNALGAIISRETAGRYSGAEAIAQADGMFPQASDWPSTRVEKQVKQNQMFDTEEAGNTTLDRFGLKQKPASAPQYKKVNGVIYMRGPNGEPIKVK